MTDSKFIALEQMPQVKVNLDGEVLYLAKGENLAAALLKEGVCVFRKTHKSGAPRGPYCMMGTCFDCLVDINGESKQACMEVVKENMQIKRGGLIG